MNFEHHMRIGGYVVKYGKIVDGIEHVRECRIKNTIVDSGLRSLLQLNMSNALPTGSLYYGALSACLFTGKMYSSSRGGGRCGSLQYGSYGDNAAPTAYSDTDLHNRTGPFAEAGGTDYQCGSTAQPTSFGTGQKALYVRTRYAFPAVSETTTIREAGVFSRRYEDNILSDYDLFARIVLDSQIELNAGEQFVFYYEIEITFPVIEYGRLTGLVDGNGNPIYYTRKYVTRMTNAHELPRYSMIRDQTYMSCATAGTPMYGQTAFSGQSTNNLTNSQTLMMPFDFASSSSSSYLVDLTQPWYSTDTTKDFPADNTAESNLARANLSAVAQVSCVVNDYDAATYSRTVDVTLPANSFNTLNPSDYTDIAYMMVNGVAYRFGHTDTDGVTWIPQPIRKTGTQKFKYQLTFSFGRF